MATFQEQMEELNAAIADLRRELGKALWFDKMARVHWLLPWIWAALLILSVDVAIQVTTAVLDQLCGGQCFR